VHSQWKRPEFGGGKRETIEQQQKSESNAIKKLLRKTFPLFDWRFVLLSR
jgi:hypothetical protein